MAQQPHDSTTPSPVAGSGKDNDDRLATRRAGKVSRTPRAIRTEPPAYRWECPCQDPPVLLATYGPGGRMNIKVRDRYWHVFGFGQVQAICPKCAAEHVLDIRRLQDALDDDLVPDQMM